MRKAKSKEGKYWGPELSPEEFEEGAIGSVDMNRTDAKEAMLATKSKTMEEIEDKLQKPRNLWRDEDWAEYTVRYRINLFNTIKEFQPYDPEDPDIDHYFARGLRQQFAEFLLEKGEIEDTAEDFAKIKFYTLSKVTDLDRACGIDGVLEYTDKNGNAQIVTFDLTTNKDKEKGYFADVVVLDKRLHHPSEEAARREMMQYAENKGASAKIKREEKPENKIYRDEFIQKLDAFARLAYREMKPVEESFKENFKKHEPPNGPREAE
jgi:hypothetical protein